MLKGFYNLLINLGSCFRRDVLEFSFGLELPKHCFRYWNCFYLLNQSDLSKVVQESQGNSNCVGCAGAGRAGGSAVAAQVEHGYSVWGWCLTHSSSEFSSLWSDTHYSTLHHFSFLKKQNLSFLVEATLTARSPGLSLFFYIFRLINTLRQIIKYLLW